MIGHTVIVETSNHLQTVGVLDLYLRGTDEGVGRIKLADGGGLARAHQEITLARQIRDLETRINNWENDKNVKKTDLADRRADLDRLRQQKRELESKVDPTPHG